ncbi:MAG: DUF192 domain-containing protein [Patescibacteria group bacterium]
MSLKNNKQKIYLLVFIFFLFFAFFWQRFYFQKIEINLANQELKVLVAKSIYQQKKGLGGRKEMKNFDAMLFPYNSLARHGIVMRDMNFAIDIIWLKNTEIVDMAPHVDPEPGVDEAKLHIYYPRTVANMVLELPAGFIEQNQLKIGDKILIVE